jgi:hypothetical protein
LAACFRTTAKIERKLYGQFVVLSWVLVTLSCPRRSQ